MKDAWNIPPYEIPWLMEHFVVDRATKAHAAGKPIIIEETGSRASYYGGDRDSYLREVFASANAANYAGEPSFG